MRNAVLSLHRLTVFNMAWWFLIPLLMHKPYAVTDASCPVPTKFFIDCSITRTISDATRFCNRHSMNLVNLTNSSATLISDLATLNQSLVSQHCVGLFWFSSGNQTGLATDVADIGELAINLLTAAANAFLCVVLHYCPGSTTAAPITNAITVCTRPIQPAVIQKCPSSNVRTDMKTFRFKAQSVPAGLLDSFAVQSQMACSALCSTETLCVGIFYDNDMCNLYM